MNKEELYTRTEELIQAWKINQERLIATENNYMDLKATLDITNAKIESEVANQLDINGKPQFSNADKRNAEVSLRKQEYPMYKQLQEENKQHHNLMKEIELECNALEMMIKLNTAMIGGQ